MGNRLRETVRKKNTQKGLAFAINFALSKLIGCFQSSTAHGPALSDAIEIVMSNDPTEQILESLLEERLGGKTPPDLSQRIVEAWQHEKLVGQTPAAQINESAVPKAPAARPIVAELVDPSSKANGSIKPASTASKKRNGRSMNWRMLLASSAAVAFGLAGWALREQFFSPAENQQIIADNPTDSDPGVDSTADDSAVEQGQSLAGNVNADKPRSRQRPGGVPVPIEDLPFSTHGNQQPEIEKIAVAKPSVEPLSDGEVVAAIDTRLAEMWQQSGVQPTSGLDNTGWFAKASERLIGKSLPGLGQPNRLTTANRLAASTEFSRTFGEEFTAAWLARSPGAYNQDTKKIISSTIQDRLSKGKDFGNVVVDLLGGELPGDLDAPESPTQAFVGSLAGEGNHRLLQRIGSEFLSTNLACIKCHDRSTETKDQLATRSGMLDQQAGYWSLIAMLRGVNVRIEDGQRVPTDAQSDLFSQPKTHNEFFELPNGRMKAAVATLPDGTVWQPGNSVPRVELAKWIAQSNEFDLAIANQVWDSVIGGRLTQDVSYPDYAAIESRVQLLRMLAEQYRASGRSVQKLASWIASSKAFDRQPLVLSNEQLVLASDAQLEQIKLARRLFAAAQPRDQQPLERSLMLAANYRKSSTGDEATLAQPAPTTRKSSPKPAPRGKSNPDQLAFTLGADHVSFGNAHYVDSLLDSTRLTWDQRVNHVVKLDATGRVSDRVRELANTLLQRHDGDSRAALLDLLWAVQRSM